VTLRSDDRVLLLDIPSEQEIAVLARILVKGVVVALGSRDLVDRARAALSDFENVMLIEATPDRIPWHDQYFTRILVPAHLRELARTYQAELNRVLAPNGQIETTAINA
jgi:ubiquinone/menaquinone biosynthesis C-methylase UbiE